MHPLRLLVSCFLADDCGQIVMAMAFAGKTTFNPMTDTIPLPNGGEFRFTSPSADDLPARGFDKGAAITTVVSFTLRSPG